MSSSATVPGLYFTAVRRPPAPSPLRSDVAGFIGVTRRGPLGRTIRVEGWREYIREFGGLLKDAPATYAIRGYFDNGGEVAWVVRLGRGLALESTPKDKQSTPAFGTWTVGSLDINGNWEKNSPGQGGFRSTTYRIEATSPGAWANGTTVTVRYLLSGASGAPEIDFEIAAPDEPVELFTNLSPSTLEEQVQAASALIRITAEPPIIDGTPPGSPPGPRYIEWVIPLQGGGDEPPGRVEYLTALRKLGDQPEVALVALPDLHDRIKKEHDRIKMEEESLEILRVAIEQAEELRDRLVLIDVPTDPEHAETAIKEPAKAIEWVESLRSQVEPAVSRAAAAYHPRLWVRDPLGGIATPLRSVPPSGHVAGVISRLDRERGAHHTPANAPVLEAVDVTDSFEEGEQGRFNTEGLNLIRCFPGRGLQVWGGRTLGRDPSNRFVAHRRLIHRLVRAIRRIAEPLVFDTNGPELWLTLTRAIRTVLLEAYRAGALKGARPDEAFQIVCDEKTNPPEERDLGRCLCEIQLAPAVPMEFIELRVALSSEGMLEVFEE
jgi:hypothetical protein